MLVGTYHILIQGVECSFHVGTSYREKTRTYISNRRVECRGVVNDNTKTSELLIDGKADLNGMPCILTIENADSIPLTDADRKQTSGFGEPFPPPAFISRVIGDIEYESGIRDQGQPFTIERGLYGFVFLDDQAFLNLWECCVVGKTINGFSLDVFGSAMSIRQSFFKVSYHWDISGGKTGLLICGFGFHFNR
jgi:hypothetical protein